MGKRVRLIDLLMKRGCYAPPVDRTNICHQFIIIGPAIDEIRAGETLSVRFTWTFPLAIVPTDTQCIERTLYFMLRTTRTNYTCIIYLFKLNSQLLSRLMN